MSRQVSGGQVIHDQLDIYSPNTITRLIGVTIPQIELLVFTNNVDQNWVLADGSAVLDTGISSGTVYFDELTTNPGYYRVRFFPGQVGFWRLIYKLPSIQTEIIKEYDVLAVGALQPGPNVRGLVSSFESSGSSC